MNIIRQEEHIKKEVDALTNMIFTDKGVYIPSYEEVKHIDQKSISTFCLINAMYNFIVQEQIDWLKENLDLTNCIEIGSGNGILAEKLGIRATDSYIQNNETIQLYYKSMGQPPVKYGPNVEEIDANKAVEKYKPVDVLGCWVTNKSSIPGQGNYWGVEEDIILKQVKKYVVIGNTGTHHIKPILALPHKEYSFPWLISRSLNREGNRIYVWET